MKVVFFAFAIFAAMGCGGESEVSNSSEEGEVDTFGDGMPMGTPMGNIGKSSSNGDDSGAGGDSGFSLPESGWGLAGVILGLVLLVSGCALIYRGNLRWGVPLALAGLAAFVAVLGWGGLSLSPPWEWHLVFWVLLAAWCLAKATAFTRWDDRIVVLGSLGMLVLTLVGRGILGGYAPGSPLWWILECAWVLLIAEAILKSQALQARPFARYGSLAAGWAILGVLS